MTPNAQVKMFMFLLRSYCHSRSFCRYAEMSDVIFKQSETGACPLRTQRALAESRWILLFAATLHDQSFFFFELEGMND